MYGACAVPHAERGMSESASPNPRGKRPVRIRRPPMGAVCVSADHRPVLHLPRYVMVVTSLKPMRKSGLVNIVIVALRLDG